MAMQKVDVHIYEKVRKENEFLREMIFSMIRRYEGRIQRLKDDCEHDFGICEKYRLELHKTRGK